MKKILLSLTISLLSVVAFAQRSSNQINKQLTFKTWVDGETRNINGYMVTRENGADYGNERNASFGMITSIAYQKQDAKSFLEFYITRYDQSFANMKWFMFIIRDEFDKEKLWEQKLEYKACEMPDGNYYWNYTTVPIPQNIQPPFYVYIRDRNIDLLTAFKFKIEPVK